MFFFEKLYINIMNNFLGQMNANRVEKEHLLLTLYAMEIGKKQNLSK